MCEAILTKDKMLIDLGVVQSELNLGKYCLQNIYKGENHKLVAKGIEWLVHILIYTNIYRIHRLEQYGHYITNFENVLTSRTVSRNA